MNHSLGIKTTGEKKNHNFGKGQKNLFVNSYYFAKYLGFVI